MLNVALWLLQHPKHLLNSVMPLAGCDCGLYKHVTSLTNTWKQGEID